jgi:hypothetical protein
LAGATSGIAVKTVVTADELGVFGALDGGVGRTVRFVLDHSLDS